MPAFLLSFATGLVGPKFAKPAIFAVLGILVLLALWGGKCAYDASVIDRYTSKQEIKQVKLERKADANLEQQKGRDDAASQQRRQEIDNATKNIPDQAPSTRQRSIACVELRREAKAHRRPEPAC